MPNLVLMITIQLGKFVVGNKCNYNTVAQDDAKDSSICSDEDVDTQDRSSSVHRRTWFEELLSESYYIKKMKSLRCLSDHQDKHAIGEQLYSELERTKEK